MKKIAFLLLTTCMAVTIQVKAQKPPTPFERYGRTINVGVGVGYYGYLNQTLPVGLLNYEFDIARNFTLAPFVTVYSFQDSRYYGNPNTPGNDPSYRYYTYRETAIATGMKGTYYFDQLFRAGSKWDFYAAGSLGFVFRAVNWENAYTGDRDAYNRSSPLYLDAHVGAEYHCNQNIGLVLDLSTGVSSFGLAIHF